LSLLFRRAVAERVGTILLSALVAHTAWHWMTERFSALREYRFAWPSFDVLLLAAVMRAAGLVLVIAVAGWGLYGLYRRLLEPRAARPESVANVEG
jgi:hypothetical protein